MPRCRSLLKLGVLLQLVVGANTWAAALEYPVGSMVAYPIANVTAGYDGNLIVGDDTDQRGSWFVGAAVGGGLQGEKRGHLYGVEYVADGRLYGRDSVADYIDQRLVGYWGTAINSRNNVDIGAELLRSHDPRGEEDPTLGSRHSVDADEPDEWDQSQLGGLYVYGADGARGRFKLSGCETCRRYTNNDQEYRDLDVLDLGATLYARVSPKVYGFVQFVHSDFTYTDDGDDNPTEGRSLDSTEMRYLVGAEWEATRRTSGRARIGWLEKDFEKDSGRDDYSDLTWDIRAIWTPRSFSTWEARYYRQTYETVYTAEDFLDDYVQVQEVGLSWNQSWSSRFSSNAYVYRGWDDFHPSDRSDDRYGAAFGVDYVVNSWLTVGITYVYQTRNSSISEHDYDDQSVLLHMNIGQILGLGYRERGPDICDLR